ncbi:ATP-binding protein [Sphingomonas quercus]|uniref:ATP-binding protein n=1 Tax=Sphingomonas quercus TaxID=2842451 RepID=A0ABS6BMZ7_9SPHN|nr:ATP-binding protein [Sphingomonas quercus]MBU3079227.1 ATP-binding protein [Sphingomonas quercus]
MPTMIPIGAEPGGIPAEIELEELLASRLLVQGNSGSGKSHLLRRLLEQSANFVQQVVIDPEGDFGSLSQAFGHLVVEAADYTEQEIASIAARVREHRISVVLNLEGLEVDAQLRCAGGFLNRLFEAPREQWYPVLVVVDEAQLFAPAAAGEVGEDARRVSLGAMTNLMCRGRKRGLAGVIATQRLAKLAKNVAAEASNFLMGRTFLDIDMLRAADLLGMERRQAEQIRDLARGQFLALGPALSRRPRLIHIGAVVTSSSTGVHSLMPLPSLGEADRQALLFDGIEAEPPPPPAPRVVEPVTQLIARIEASTAPSVDAAPDPDRDAAIAGKVDAVLSDIVADVDDVRAPAAVYQDFVVRCRMHGLLQPPLTQPGFSRRLALARAGFLSAELAEPDWRPALDLAEAMPDDMIGVFMLLARAARDREPCPGDGDLARVYGTQSLGRVRRLVGYMESKGYVAFRTDLRGRRTATIPQLGWTTEADAGGGGELRARG